MKLKARILFFSVVICLLFVSSKVNTEAAPPEESRLFLTLTSFFEYKAEVEETLENIDDRLTALEELEVACYINHEEFSIDERASEYDSPETFLANYLSSKWRDGWTLGDLVYLEQTGKERFLFQKCYDHDLNASYNFAVFKVETVNEIIPVEYQGNGWELFFRYEIFGTEYSYIFLKQQF